MLYATNQVVRTDLIIFTPLKDSVFNVNKQKIVIVEAINKINLPFDVRWILKLIPLCNPDWITQGDYSCSWSAVRIIAHIRIV